MSIQKVVIIGAGGFGREVLDVLEACNQAEPRYEILGFIVEPDFQKPGTLINDAPVLGGFDWLEAHHSDVFAVCGVGEPATRRRLIQEAVKAGARFFSLVHPSVILTRWLTMGSGSILTAGCILTNNIRIGEHVHINLDCTIGHDVVIEGYVTVSPGVHISGNVTLKEGCFIGTGANIIEGKTVGSWSVVGAGSVVVKDVPANSTVVGVPGVVAKERPAGWHLDNKK